jgi:hypothetical protein
MFKRLAYDKIILSKNDSEVSSMASINLQKAKENKKDEFYTQYEDIEKELVNYKEQFKDKIVYCNCDDPKWSNFTKFFLNNFKYFELKKLICTHFEIDKPSYKLIATRDENGIVTKSEIGTPQGGNLSPLLSNIMLNELDKELEKRGLYFVRYADDYIITVKSEKAANRAMESITNFIQKKLGLKVNVTKSKVAKPTEIKYLGFGFYYDKNGKIKPKPHLKTIQKFKRKLKFLTKRSWSISLDERIIKLNQVIRGWINYFKIGDMKSAMKVISEHLRHRIRMIIWKQWKLIKPRYNALIKLGIKPESARQVANTRRSYYWVASTVILHIAISNKRLQQKGLVFPLDHYLKVHSAI